MKNVYLPHSNNDCLSYILFLLYAAVIAWLIPRIPFLRGSGIGWKTLIALFTARAAAGAINCYLSIHFFQGTDSLAFHNIGLNEYYLLLHLPRRFFEDFFFDPYNAHYAGLFDVTRSFWNNLKMNVIVKSIAFADIITWRSYYTNTLLFNFLVFFGSVALYRVFMDLFAVKKWILIVLIFLFPSALYYTTAIHRDGLLFLSIGIIMYGMHRLLQDGPIFKRILFITLFFVFIFSLRNFVALVLLPALAGWWLAYKKPTHGRLIFLSLSALCVLLFFTTKYVVPTADFPLFVSERSAAFDAISVASNTYLPMPPLRPTFTGFVAAAPLSIYHGFFLPAFWDFPNPMSFPFVIELFFVWILFGLYLAWPVKRKKSPVLLFILFFCAVNILMIGYTIPNLGALLRYRSIYLQLLSIGFMVSINWDVASEKTGLKFLSRFAPANKSND